MRKACLRRWARPIARGVMPGVLLVIATVPGMAQQFNSDNQWVAPHGVGTIVATAGQEYSALLLTGALLRETEFTVGVTRYEGDSRNRTDAHHSGTFYVKRRLAENEAGTGGWAIMGGTGISPGYLEGGSATDTFRTWWANGVYTVPFRGGAVTWDLLPGFLLNLDKDQSERNAWGMTYSSRVAIYKVIPQCALVGEVFGTTGEAGADTNYRAGVRWESPRVVVAATYGDSFDGEGSPRFEIGVMAFTNPLRWLCIGGGCKP